MGLGFIASDRPAARKGLSEAAQAAMVRGFAAGWTAERIAQAVKDETGETVSPRTVARRAAEWRESKRRFDAGVERWKALMEAAKDSPGEVSGMVQAIAKDALLANPNILDGADPVKMTRASLEAEKVALARRKIEVQERLVTVQEGRLKLLEEREARATAVLQKESVEMTPEQRLEEIRGIYGLRG